MEWAIVAIVVIALAVAALAAAGGMGGMPTEPIRDIYRQSLPAEPLTAGDLSSARFGITLRGYAMDQVDDLLARLAREIEDRDALIANPQYGRADRVAADSDEQAQVSQPAPVSVNDQPVTAQPGPPAADRGPR